MYDNYGSKVVKPPSKFFKKLLTNRKKYCKIEKKFTPALKFHSKYW